MNEKTQHNDPQESCVTKKPIAVAPWAEPSEEPPENPMVGQFWAKPKLIKCKDGRKYTRHTLFIWTGEEWA